MARFKPEFVAIIGYSFAWRGHRLTPSPTARRAQACTGGHRHDDAVSLDCFVDHYREFPGPVFVVEPHPERLQEILAQRLHAAHVVALPARCNLLAHGFLEAVAGRLNGRTLNDYCSALFDSGVGEMAYPFLADRN